MLAVALSSCSGPAHGLEPGGPYLVADDFRRAALRSAVMYRRYLRLLVKCWSRRPSCRVGKPAQPPVLLCCGREAVAVGGQTIEGIEEQLAEILGERGHRDL